MVGLCLCLLTYKYQRCIGIIFELWKGDQSKPLGRAPWRPPNQTGWDDVQTHDSVDRDMCLDMTDILFPRLFQFIQLKQVPFKFIQLIIVLLKTLHFTSTRIYFSSRLEINRMMILNGSLFILELIMDTNTTVYKHQQIKLYIIHTNCIYLYSVKQPMSVASVAKYIIF